MIRVIFIFCFSILFILGPIADTRAQQEEPVEGSQDGDYLSRLRKKRFVETEETAYQKILELGLGPEQVEASLKKVASPEVIAAAKEKVKNEVLGVNKELKDLLKNYIQNDWKMLKQEFKVSFNPYLDPYDLRYKDTLIQFRALYGVGSKATKAILDKVLEVFGQKIADKVAWIFERWKWWEYYCYGET